MVLAMLENAANNVVNPSQEALEVAFKLLPTVSLVNVHGLVVRYTTVPTEKFCKLMLVMFLVYATYINNFDFSSTLKLLYVSFATC